tara:strand:- start:201 stop:623 length:423 start_codon:yes stop_codon:yes gene_type:complete
MVVEEEPAIDDIDISEEDIDDDEEDEDDSDWEGEVTEVINDIQHKMYNDNQKLHSRVTRQQVEISRLTKEYYKYKTMYKGEYEAKRYQQELVRILKMDIEENKNTIDVLTKFQKVSCAGYVVLAWYYIYNSYCTVWKMII